MGHYEEYFDDLLFKLKHKFPNSTFSIFKKDNRYLLTLLITPPMEIEPNIAVLNNWYYYSTILNLVYYENPNIESDARNFNLKLLLNEN